MLLYSTNNEALRVDFKTAVMRSLPEDNGLYMPVEIPKLPDEFFRKLKSLSFSQLSFEVARQLIGDDIPEEILKTIVGEAINFDAPLVKITDQLFIQELFHGPTLAFKDFGARFMSRVMKYFNTSGEKVYILVATSGDTGGAVASGFYDVEGIEVIILFPKGKVSPLQQKQLTTLGRNIKAIEIEGSFDTCQDLVKKAFLDEQLNSQFNLSSANSINIARLIPQSFYYFNAVRQLPEQEEVVFVVPSGNFGNLTAGVLAERMGLPVRHFVAATNINDVVPEYLHTGIFKPRPSVPTISNAMDVGNPSNFYRMARLLGSTWNNVKNKLTGYAFTDDQTRQAMQEVYRKYGYVLDPHGAVGFLAAQQYRKDFPGKYSIVLMETAHPSKFIETVEETLGTRISIPDQLLSLKSKDEIFHQMPGNFQDFKNWLLSRS